MSVGAMPEVEPKPPLMPTRWWQWLILYPAVIGTVASAATPAVDKIHTAWVNWHKRAGLPDIASYSESKEQSRLWRENASCNTLQKAWVTLGDGAQVDTTICPSGDVLIAARDFYHHPYNRWIALRRQVILPDADNASASNTLALSDLLFSAAKADTPPDGPLQSVTILRAQFMPGQPQLLCQRPLDQRLFLRRVATPQGCFNQIIDTFTGAIVQVVPAPCTPQC